MSENTDLREPLREVLDIAEAAQRLRKFHGQHARLRMLTRDAPSHEIVSALDGAGIDVVLSPHLEPGRKFLVGPDGQGRSLPYSLDPQTGPQT